MSVNLCAGHKVRRYRGADALMDGNSGSLATSSFLANIYQNNGLATVLTVFTGTTANMRSVLHVLFSRL